LGKGVLVVTSEQLNGVMAHYRSFSDQAEALGSDLDAIRELTDDIGAIHDDCWRVVHG